MRAAILSIVLLALLSPPATAQNSRQLLYGAPVRVSSAKSADLSGELLAVDNDSLWLLQPGHVVAVPTSSISMVRVDRQKLGAGYGIARSLIFGAATGGALAAACSSESSGCGRVIPVSIGLSFLFGLLASPSLDKVKYLDVHGANPASLRPWARFPQGLPPGLSRDSLVKGIR